MITIGQALDRLLEEFSRTRAVIRESKIAVKSSAELFHFKLIVDMPPNYELAFPEFGSFTVLNRELTTYYSFDCDASETARSYSVEMVIKKGTKLWKLPKR